MYPNETAVPVATTSYSLTVALTKPKKGGIYTRRWRWVTSVAAERPTSLKSLS